MSCPRRHMCWQSKRFYWGRAPRWRAGGSGNPGELLCHVACSLGFYGDGVGFRVVFSQSSDSESFQVVYTLFSQDGCQWERFREVVGYVVFAFDLSQTLLVGGSLLVPCSLPGPPLVKQLTQVVTMVPGQSGRFQSVCFPNTASEYSGLISFKIDLFDLLMVGPRGSQECFPAQFKIINSSELSLLYGPTLTSVHDYWKHHSFD